MKDEEASIPHGAILLLSSPTYSKREQWGSILFYQKP
jgi:hypothetical protein